MYLPPSPPIPSPNPDCEQVISIERTLAKFKAAVFRVGFNLWDIFKDLDQRGIHFISESEFLSVLLGPLRELIGLSTTEISQLTDYLKKSDGRIAYTQLCKLVHDNENPFVKTSKEAEHEDPQTGNRLSTLQEQKILEILTKIAIQVLPRNMLIKPFFQDSELIRRGPGQVSRNSYLRVMKFLGLTLSQPELDLLFEKYRYDAFTFKYDAFLKQLEEVRHWLSQRGYVDGSGRLRPAKIGPVGTLPKPELSTASRCPQAGIQKVWGWPAVQLSRETVALLDRLREQVYREKLQVADYFRLFDEADSGRVPKAIFEKCLFDWICVSETRFNNLYVAPHEMELLLKVYTDPEYTDRVLWKVFVDDLERGMDPEELCGWPSRKSELRCPLNPFVALRRPPSPQPSQAASLSDSLEHVRRSMEERPESRALLSAFPKHDRKSTGFIGEDKFEWSFVEAGIFLNQNEKQRLRERYCGPQGASWRDFVKDLQAHEENIKEKKKSAAMEEAKKESQEQDRIKAEMAEGNIVEVLGKIKKYLVCKRFWIHDFLKDFDPKKTGLIGREDFLKGLEKCGLFLTKKEIETLIDVFALPSDPSKMEYERLCRTVDEESLPPCLVRLPHKEALAKDDLRERQALDQPQHQFVNFNERLVVAEAIEKLTSHVSLANTDFFKGKDPRGTGTLSRLAFQRALHKLGCLHLLTNRELDTILFGFGLRRGTDIGLDYMAFLNALDIVSKTKKAAKTQ